MPLTLPTADGQSLEAFGEELAACIKARVMALVPYDRQTSAWVCVEETGAEDVVVELRGIEDGRDHYYRVPYSRGEGGRLVAGDPQPVEEVTTYEPVAAPPSVLARAVLCESLPVHAPPADGLTRGRPVQLLRVGPLHDLQTGAHLLDVTDDLCAAIAASAAKAGFAVPVDMGHALYASHPGDAPALYGRIVEVEARAGLGLWGTPEWTSDGAALVASNPGLYYLSPTLLGTPHDPRTGEAMPGRTLHSVSLTPTPRQDGLDSLALSRAAAGAASPTGGPMAGNQGTGAPKQPDDVVTLSRTEHDALVLARRERDEMKAKADAAEAAALTLSQRVEAMEAREHARAVDDEVKAAEAKGHIVSADLRAKLLSMPADVRALVLASTAKRALGAMGHGEHVEPVAPNSAAAVMAAVKMSREKGIGYNDALRLANGGTN